MRPLLLAVIAAGAFPAAAAGATWTPPQDLSSAHEFVDRPGLTVSGDGTALATWVWSDATGSEGRIGVDAAVRPPGAGVFGPERRLSPERPFSAEQLTAGPVAFGRDQAVLATARPVNRDPVLPRLRLAVRVGRAGGRFGAARAIRTSVRIRDPRLAANARGDVALAWWEDRGVRTDRVYVALRRAGGRFGAPIRLTTGRIRGIGVAIGASGDVIVAWDGRGVVRTRFKPRRRRGFLRTDTIVSRPAFNALLRPAVAPNGRAVVAWSAQFTTEGGNSGPIFFEVAVRARGARRFHRAQTLEEMGPDQVPRDIDQVVDSAGRNVVAWSGSDGLNRRLVVARMDADGRFHNEPVVSPPGVNARLSDLAAGPRGRLLVVWDDWDFEISHQVFAAYAPDPGQPFGAPEPVSPYQEARAGVAAFDPRSGEPTVVWTNRPLGSSARPIRTVAQASRRIP
jgi:hypothetical protein